MAVARPFDLSPGEGIRPLPPGTPMANFVTPPASPRQAARLAAVHPPSAAGLPGIPVGARRYGPLNRLQRGAVDPRNGESFRFPAVRPVDLIAGFSEILGPLGFQVTFPTAPVNLFTPPVMPKALPQKAGFELNGYLLFERELRTAPDEQRKGLRLSVAGIAGGAAVLAIGLYLALGRNPPIPPFAYLSGLGLATILYAFTNLRMRRYWSDVVVINYEGRVVEKPTLETIMRSSTDFSVQVQVVRALTEDWSSRWGGGRTIRSAVPTAELGSVLPTIRSRLTARPLA